MLNTFIAHVVTLACLGLAWLLSPDILLDAYAKLATFGSVLYLSFLIASLVDNLLPRFRVSATKKAVFITGCDTGFGNLLAQRLDSIGFKVFAGCLEPDGPHARALVKVTSRRLRVVGLDVTLDSSVDGALKTVESNLGECELWAIVNNAGIIVRGEAEWMPMFEYQKQFEVNTFGVVRVTKAFLPLLREHGGRVVTTTSMGGRFTFSGFVPYCMSKHAANSFCAGLRMEMAKFGVKVITVEPFSHKSPMTEMTTVLQSAVATWRRRPASLQAPPYDEGYFEAFKDSVRRFNEATAQPRIHRVVDAMVEAVCATSPHYSYAVGDARSHLDMWFGRRIPTSWADFMVRRTVTFDSGVESYLKRKEKDQKSL